MTPPCIGESAVPNDLGWGAIGIVVGAVVTGFFTWLSAKSKGTTDQSIAVLEQWSELNKGISDRLATVEREFADYRQQMAKDVEQLRTDHAAEIEKIRREHSAEIEEMRKKHRTEMRTLRDQNDELRRHNEGLQRMIAQNSQSNAQLLSESPVTHPRDHGDDE